jgi:hypothetical protein
MHLSDGRFVHFDFAFYIVPHHVAVVRQERFKLRLSFAFALLSLLL